MAAVVVEVAVEAGGQGSSSSCDSRSSSDQQKPPGPNNTPSGQLNRFPIFRKQLEGTTFTFCQKCGSSRCWSTNHSTGGHTGPVRDNNKHSATSLSAHFSLVSNPSASYMSFTWETFLFNLWGVLGPYLIGLLGSVAIYALWSIGWGAMAPVMWIVNFGLFWYIHHRFLHEYLSVPHHSTSIPKKLPVLP
jgi:hypothetical protein